MYLAYLKRLLGLSEKWAHSSPLPEFGARNTASGSLNVRTGHKPFPYYHSVFYAMRSTITLDLMQAGVSGNRLSYGNGILNKIRKALRRRE